MLTDPELEFFKAFGYAVTNPGAFSDVTKNLHQECARALSTAYPRDIEGTLQLPAMSEETPLSIALVHDERLLRCVESIVGPCAILKPPKITRFSRPTNWHRDCYMPLRGLKIATYFATRQDDAVLFDVIPASHTGPVRSYVDALFGKERFEASKPRDPNRTLPANVPTYSIKLTPGQMLLFDLGLWHGHLASGSRLQWGVSFVAAPEGEHALSHTVSHLGEFFEYKRTYPNARFPYYPPSWETGQSDSTLALALKSSGVLAQYLSHYGRGR